MKAPPPPEREQLDGELWGLLQQVEELLETPMVILGFVWLVLIMVELLWGLGGVLSALFTTIWLLFVLDFALRLVLAPSKGRYLRRNWLTALSLVVPGLRLAQIVRFVHLARLAPATRTVHLVAVVGSANRGMRALRASFERHGAGYVLAVTVIVVMVGAAGMLAFEQTAAGAGFGNYGESLWWTAMLITTLGSGFWPVTPEGRALALLLSVYGVGILGFITAALASFLVGRDAESGAGEVASERALRELREEIRALREELQESQPPDEPEQ